MGDGSRVLVIEDDGLVASFVIDLLDDLGLTAVGPFATSKDAGAWLQGDTPDAAVVDVALPDGTSAGIVVELRHRGVPVVIFSGLDPWDVPPILHGSTLLSKPASVEALTRAISRAVEGKPTTRRGVSPSSRTFEGSSSLTF